LNPLHTLEAPSRFVVRRSMFDVRCSTFDVRHSVIHRCGISRLSTRGAHRPFALQPPPVRPNSTKFDQIRPIFFPSVHPELHPTTPNYTKINFMGLPRKNGHAVGLSS